MKSKSGKGKRSIGIVVATIVVVGLVGYYFIAKRSAANGANAYREEVIERGDLDLAVQATGTVGPENRLVVKPQIAGRVDEVLVDEGVRVRAGQVIAWMSSSDRAALIDMARAKGEAEVRHWEDIYKPTPIIAPLSGVVIAKNVERGQAVTTSDTAFVISDRLIVTAQVDETDLSRITMNQPVELRLDAYADKPLAGKVLRIAYEAKSVNNVTVYEIRVLPDSVPEYMRAGMSVSTRFLEQRREGVVLVPVSFLIRAKGESGAVRPGPARVLVRRPEGSKERTPEERTLELGINDGRLAEVISGLSEKDVVVVEDKSGDAKKQTTNPFMPRRPERKKAGK